MAESASWASTPGVRRRMQLQKERDTKPERALRSALHGKGLRFRIDRPVIPGTRRRVDIVFGPARVAVFVDGCFWHGCREHGRSGFRSNERYWTSKILGNKERDRDTDRRLVGAGWLSLRVWECQDVGVAAGRIAAAVDERRPRSRSSGRTSNDDAKATPSAAAATSRGPREDHHSLRELQACYSPGPRTDG